MQSRRSRTAMQRGGRGPNSSQFAAIKETAMLSAKRTAPTTFLLLLMASTSAITLNGQALPSTPHTPDLLGIYPGMPLSEAQATLQKHSSAYYVRRDPSDSQLSLSIANTKDTDVINVFMTQPPNDPFVAIVK